eukprot:COSAG03_NODE_5611_length_1210_cov_1.056706_2_plen_125_part_00
MEKARWTVIIAKAQAGDLSWFMEEEPKVFMMQYNTIQKIMRDYMPAPPDLQPAALTCLWYHGSTGTGKSLKAHTENPGAYIKPSSKWWDAYRKGTPGHLTIIIYCFKFATSPPRNIRGADSSET